ncbi:DUF4294 domain-containing protein [Mucilaginibacter calamicampi]|uniref:DUF4294 domain-containing protein n=1 Tax=Mucilaginibacter calamicampi TaxID=1302352 RepID=A0ABW2YSN6_9SPHI
MKFIGLIIVCCCVAGVVKAQEAARYPVLGKNDTIRTYSVEYEGERIPWMVAPEVQITDVRIFRTQADRDAYRRLKYNVYKVIPYARFAGQRYRQLERDLALTGDKRKQKALVKSCETQIKDMFNKEIENLTVTQGEILIKLIDRETDNTTYALVKELKGGFNAFLLQSAARIFGHNLKQEYDREEQHDIEYILQQAGYDSYIY